MQCVSLPNQIYKIGDIVIPGDIKLFNKMWLNKEFDKISLAEITKHGPPKLCRETNNKQSWDTTFFMKRKELLYNTAEEIWKKSIYYRDLCVEIDKILYTTNPLEGADFEFCFPEEMQSNYLSLSPEEAMFLEKKMFTYQNPAILPIYRDLIVRFQLLGNRMNDERISIYLDELILVGEKIRFIQTLCYYGMELTVIRFKKFKHNYSENDDPETEEIMNEPILCEEFWKKSFKKVLYDFYSLCASPERITKEKTERIYFIGNMVIHYDDIQLLVSSYLLSMRSCINQDKLLTICCQLVLSYLRPAFITEQCLASLLV
jgi:hypothetical protein